MTERRIWRPTMVEKDSTQLVGTVYINSKRENEKSSTTKITRFLEKIACIFVMGSIIKNNKCFVTT